MARLLRQRPSDGGPERHQHGQPERGVHRDLADHVPGQVRRDLGWLSGRRGLRLQAAVRGRRRQSGGSQDGHRLDGTVSGGHRWCRVVPDGQDREQRPRGIVHSLGPDLDHLDRQHRPGDVPGPDPAGNAGQHAVLRGAGRSDEALGRSDQPEWCAVRPDEVDPRHQAPGEPARVARHPGRQRVDPRPPVRGRGRAPGGNPAVQRVPEQHPAAVHPGSERSAAALQSRDRGAAGRRPDDTDAIQLRDVRLADGHVDVREEPSVRTVRR